MLKSHLKTQVCPQYSAPWVFWALSSRTHVILPRTCAHQPYNLQRTLCPGPRHHYLTQGERSWTPPPVTYLPKLVLQKGWFLFLFILEKKLMKSTRTDTTFLFASWTSLIRNQNEISQHSKGPSEWKLILKPTGKGKWFERFRSDVLLALKRRCWSPGSAAFLCLWLSRWHNIDDWLQN